ncbi:PhzF family phenazine biosynthesis protein [Anatilimnocola sp. NA78]|uniref:PhzF family phenazine biosynthesis protein n=1 Tax=Anatilimnocola sp. NA78 TaxID=3415683 RepID=UPI003CE5B983
MARIRCWQVDAFTNRPFAGNPAAVCWLEGDAVDTWMQAVAAEMNLAETAFIRKLPEGYELRWFTPTIEVDLCGHATLASAHALWQAGIIPEGPIRFHTRSGVLTCSRNGDWIELDFPATPAVAAEEPTVMAAALGARPMLVAQSKFDYVAIYDSPTIIREMAPDFRALGTIPVRGIMVSAVSDDPNYDFIARFFAPASGIDEDPATGSAYCALMPYWAEQLGKKELRAFQASKRGGELKLRMQGDRIILGGQAVTVWQGELL